MSRWEIVAEIRSAIKASKHGRPVPIPCHGGLSAGPACDPARQGRDRSRRTGDTQQSASTNPFRRVLKTRAPLRDPKILAGVEGVEPANAGIKIRCLNQLGDTPTQVHGRKTAINPLTVVHGDTFHGRYFTNRPEDAPPGCCTCGLASRRERPRVPSRAANAQKPHFPSQSCGP